MNVSNQFEEALSFFISTLAELAVLFVLISFVVSIVNYFLPAQKVKQLLSGNKGYTTAISLGAVTPFCSCSTIPMLIGLLKAKAQFGPVMAFLFTSPLINPFIVSLFWVTFGIKVTLIYSFFAIGMAALAGNVLQHLRFDKYVKQELFDNADTCQGASCGDVVKKEEANIQPSSCCTPTPSKNKARVFKQLSMETFTQLRSMLPYMILGVAVGAALHGFVPTAFFSALTTFSVVVLIPLSALIGVFLYVRASTMLPIAASLVGKGMSLGSVMSLTIAGAGASLPEMIMLKRLFHWQLLGAFVFTVFATACISGFVIELLV
ncbi:permease [Alteromonas facilis]|uniref:permease n=1 Tax=Alteromonas facilis TaxID=2048004 RepID=UPI001F0C275E|nr:permease [Alteromonas facilis]